MVGRVVFGEARGESMEGQLAVAYTVVNRVSHAGYPNNLYSVVYQKYGNGIYQYNTLSDPYHTTQWKDAKRMNRLEYRNAIKAAEDALCCRVSDPTRCATDYCAYDPCSATSSNRYWQATNKMQIGHHYFVCRKSAWKLVVSFCMQWMRSFNENKKRFKIIKCMSYLHLRTVLSLCVRVHLSPSPLC